MNTTSKVVTGFVTGTIVGAALGILLAPEKGTKTRAAITGKIKDMSETLDKNYIQAKKMLGLEKTKKEHVS